MDNGAIIKGVNRHVHFPCKVDLNMVGCWSSSIIVGLSSVDDLSPMLRKTDADQRERLDISHGHRRCGRPMRAIRHSTVALFSVSCVVIFGILGDSNSCSPAVVPNADDLQHIATVQRKLVVCARLVCPQGGNTITGSNVILRVIILERRKLLGLPKIGRAHV